MPTDDAYDPCAQGSEAEDPAFKTYEPADAIVHEVDPLTDEYDPTEQEKYTPVLPTKEL